MKKLFENEFGLVAVVKNESSYISEWLEHHYKIGVDKFYIYNNDSDDTEALEKILEPWIQNQIVDYRLVHGEYIFIKTVNDSLLEHRFECRYMSFLSVRQYILPRCGSVLKVLNEVFSVNELISGLVVNLRIFDVGDEFSGSVRNFVNRAVDEFHGSRQVFSIVNPRRVRIMPREDFAFYYPLCYAVNENFDKIELYLNDVNTVDKIQINDYRNIFDLNDVSKIEDHSLNELQPIVYDVSDSNFEPSIENLLTIFSSDKNLMNESLESIESALKNSEVKPYEIMMLLNMLPEMYSTSNVFNDIINHLKKWIIPTIAMCNLEPIVTQRPENYADLLFFERLLSAFK